MAYDAAVTTAFKAADLGMTSLVKKLTAYQRRFGDTSTQAFRKASAAARSHNAVMKGIVAGGAALGGIGLLTQGVHAVTTEFVGFDDAIMGAAARFKDVGPGAADFNDKLALLKKRARDAGATTEFTATQAASALDFLARAGFNSTEAMDGLQTMINLSTASGEDFSRVADMSSDLLGAFGLATEDSTQKIKNLTRLNDVLTKSANSANVTIESQFETMKVAAPIFSIFGDNLDQVAAITAAMGNAGIKGGEGATALKNAILRLAAPTPKAAAAMKTLGLSMDEISTIGADGKRNMRPMIEILKAMGPKLSKLGTTDQAAVLDKIFGKRAIAANANLIKVITSVEDFEKTLKNSGGTAAQTADLMRESLGNQIKTLQSAAFELGFQFLEAFQGEGKTGIQSMTAALREFDIGPVVNSVKAAVAVLKILWAIFSPFAPLLPYVVVGMKAYNVALIVHNSLMKGGMLSNMIRMIAIFTKKVAVDGFATASQWALNAAFAANPALWVVIGIMALIAAGILLYKNWDLVKQKFMEWTAIFDNPVFAIFAAIFAPLITIPILIARNWDTVIRTLKIAVNWFTKLLGFGAVFDIAKKVTGSTPGTPKAKEDEAGKELARARAQSQTLNGRLDVNFSNAPKGTTATPRPGRNLELNTGFN